MKKTIVLASKNPGKLKELKELFDFPDLKIRLLSSFENTEEVPEDGSTFEENAAKKALGYAEQTNCLTLADDSGLCVDFLGGAPGVYSSRYGGDQKDASVNCRKLLQELEDCPPEKRTASFVAAIALAEPNRLIEVVVGTCQGMISQELKGNQGFGYDPLFFYSPFGSTFGEATKERKNQVSHRFHALVKMRKVLEKYLASR